MKHININKKYPKQRTVGSQTQYYDSTTDTWLTYAMIMALMDDDSPNTHESSHESVSDSGSSDSGGDSGGSDGGGGGD